MEKKYNHNEKNPEQDSVKEPAVTYSTSGEKVTSKNYYSSLQEMIEGVRRGTKQIEEGYYYTDDEVDDLIL